MIRSVLARLGWLGAIKRVYYAVDNRIHLPQKRALYSQFCGQGSLVFDVGANLGQKTHVFLALGARVVSIEPERDCYEYLRTHFASDRLTVVRAAVADRPGTVRLMVDPQTPEISTIDGDWLVSGPDAGKAGQLEEQTVEAVTLSQLIERFGIPDYIKIDVEGFETPVLRGLLTPVPFVSFEFHTIQMRNIEERCTILSALGRYTFNYTLSDSYALALRDWVTADVLLDRLGALQSGGAAAPQWGDIFARLQQ
jgi:FkbM family methyltransferase